MGVLQVFRAANRKCLLSTDFSTCLFAVNILEVCALMTCAYARQSSHAIKWTASFAMSSWAWHRLLNLLFLSFTSTVIWFSYVHWWVNNVKVCPRRLFRHLQLWQLRLRELVTLTALANLLRWPFIHDLCSTHLVCRTRTVSCLWESEKSPPHRRLLTACLRSQIGVDEEPACAWLKSLVRVISRFILSRWVVHQIVANILIVFLLSFGDI